MASGRRSGAAEKRPGSSSAVSFSRRDGIYLGIDPGLASVGYGVLEAQGSRLVHAEHGVIATASSLPMGERLLAIHEALAALITKYAPVGGAMEALFFARNATSALPVAEAKGVIRLAFAQAGIELREYTPVAIKQGVVGDGRAEKAQVQEMVRVILGLSAIPKPDHAADALAACICRCNDALSLR